MITIWLPLLLQVSLPPDAEAGRLTFESGPPHGIASGIQKQQQERQQPQQHCNDKISNRSSSSINNIPTAAAATHT
ncbi:hypothetical protein Emag_002152 [Eimeria magna]